MSLDRLESRDLENNYQPTNRTSKQAVAFQLLDVEILYVLNIQPRTLNGLRESMKSLFDLPLDSKLIEMDVRFLEEEGCIRALDGKAQNESEFVRVEKPDAYTITPRGSRTLSDCIGSLAEIALTMQLGLGQKLRRV